MTHQPNTSPPPQQDEQIAHVPHALIAALALPEAGYLPDPDRSLYETLRAAVSFGDRAPLEEDPSRRQLIPYVVMGSMRGVFVMRRLSAQREARLHDRRSIGVGGHINPEADADDPIEAGMWRELREELDAPAQLAPVYQGVLRDDRAPVGRVHLGMIYTCWTEAPGAVRVREVEKMAGGWSTLGELRDVEASLEGWSALLLDHLAGWFPNAPR